MSDADLDRLSEEIFDWYVHENPLFATSMGIHEFDHLLPDGRRDAQLRELAKAGEVLERLGGIDRKALSPGKRIDRDALRNVLRMAAFEIEELGIWESMPQAADSVGAALFPLFMRDFAPLPKRMEGITARLEATPRFVLDMRTRMRTPVRLWSEIASESATRLPGFFRVIQAAGDGALPSADRSRLAEAVAKATEAFAAQVRWLETDILPRSADRVGIGATKFRKLVRIRELGITVEAIRAVGTRYLRSSKRELARVAHEVKAGASVEEAKAIVKGDHPSAFPEALAYTAKTMEDGKRFILANGLATIPPNEELCVIETPSFLRHVIPFAAYSSPARYDAKQQGFYMVTPVEDKPEMLREFSYPGVRNTAVHEGYPGHHLQLTCANLNPSKARALSSAIETIEGWAHYCEDMMKEAGFSADPSTKLVQILDQIWRACRIVIDIDLHCGRMTFDEAVDMLVREVGMERPGAVAEVRRYTYTPAYPLSYLLGKDMILRLRREVRRSLGKAYSDKFFHDTFLYAGSIPMTYMRQIFAYKVKELQKLRRKGL